MKNGSGGPGNPTGRVAGVSRRLRPRVRLGGGRVVGAASSGRAARAARGPTQLKRRGVVGLRELARGRVLACGLHGMFGDNRDGSREVVLSQVDNVVLSSVARKTTSAPQRT